MKDWFKLILCVAMALLLTFSGVLWAGFRVSPAPVSPPPSGNAAETFTPPPALPQTRMEYVQQDNEEYLLKNLDGRVAVYRLPVLVVPALLTDIPLASLRRNDAAQLNSGLRVAGRENMLKLLEDFGS